MATIGLGSTAKIAGACNDGTVRIYDSVTGGLRLSLRPEFPVLEMTGLPDGSLLVCTHGGRPLITLWDIQTGGLVHTFVLEREAQHTTVSLDGRYLACEGSKYTVNVWETAGRTQHPVPWERFQGNTPCWLAPEELIMVVDRGSVCIQNVVLKGSPVQKFKICGSDHSAVYSQIFDLLAIMSRPIYHGTSFTIFDIKTGTSSNLHTSGEPLYSVAFSQTTKELVCCWGAPGLETIDISTGHLTRFDLPATVTSVSTLSNGTMVANVQGSGIQLLRLVQERVSPQQPTPPLLAIFPLDKGRILAIVPATSDDITLLETTTLSQVLSIPNRGDPLSAFVRRVVLCASLENKIAVRYYREWSQGYLEMLEFAGREPRWTVPTGVLPPIGSISPSSARLVIVHNLDQWHFISVGDAQKGISFTQGAFNSDQDPLDVTFDSEDRFYIHYNTYRETYDIDNNTWAGNPPTTHRIIRREGQRLEGQVLQKRYSLDDGREWVFCGPQRICWVPPGYIGSAPDSHCWAGSSLVMVGQDGVLRKLTFLE